MNASVLQMKLDESKQCYLTIYKDDILYKSTKKEVKNILQDKHPPWT